MCVLHISHTEDEADQWYVYGMSGIPRIRLINCMYMVVMGIG